MQICLFEDAQHSNFHPLTLTRPVDDLRIGICTIRQKWKYILDVQNVCRILRPELQNVFDSGEIDRGQTCLWINSRYFPSEKLVEKVTDLTEGQCLKHNDTVIAAKVNGQNSAQWQKTGSPDFNTLFVHETNNFSSITYPWDVFQKNGAEISRDIELLQPSQNGQSKVSEQASLVNPEQIYIQNNATIEAGCVLNAEEGPIYIGEGATVMAGSFLRGPLAIGKDSIIKMGSRIYKDTTIGPVCKVGGEVSNTIFHSYTNKPHDGYIGNSLVGQWCNFGADTNISNLKNNYSHIRITNWANREEINTGQQFFGTVMGDHTKTAINTQLNTGTTCGVCCNIFSTEFPPKFIPSFSWVGSNVIQTYKFEKALRDMEAMMDRRNVEITSGYKKMLKSIFKDRK